MSICKSEQLSDFDKICLKCRHPADLCGYPGFMCDYMLATEDKKHLRAGGMFIQHSCGVPEQPIDVQQKNNRK